MLVRLPRADRPVVRDRRLLPSVQTDPRKRESEAQAAWLARAVGNRAFSRLVAERSGRGRAGEAGTGARLQRFGSAEHRDLGESASGHATLDITLDDGSTLTYGEMVALAGDLFESMAEVNKLLESDEGKQQVRYARFYALKVGSEAGVSDETKKTVTERYFTLAANNFAHFSAGGTASDAYETGHGDALWLAFQAGGECSEKRWNEAKAAEAFCNHYLSDMFAAGHVRTPRMEMKEWYQERYPDSLDDIVNFMSKWITDLLDSWGEPVLFSVGGIGFGPRKWIVRRQVASMVRDLGGAALKSFSLGDIVALAYHNQDNEHGLNVVSEVDSSGAEVPGGYEWTAKGDGHLAESKDTQRMAVAAMSTSLDELQEFYDAGQAASASVGLVFPPQQLAERMRVFYDAALAAHTPFRAKKYTPKEKAADSGNDQFNWRWGQLDDILRGALDKAVREDISGELRDKASGIGDGEGVVRSYGMVTHARQAVLEFCGWLEANGTKALEEAIAAKASGVEPPPAPSDAGVEQSAGVPGDSPEAGVPVGDGR